MTVLLFVLMPRLPKKFLLALVVFFSLIATETQAANTARIKDIVTYEGVRDNMLMGYGLVVGLNGTGDKLTNNKFTEESLVSFLERLGVSTRGARLKPKNIAAVSVTASLPPFARHGSEIDVTVSALGDAKSLQGGTLLATPLYGADGEVYAVGQGAVTIGGFTAGGEAETITKGVPTSGSISNGAIVEREIDFDLNAMQQLSMSLRNPDFSTASRIAEVINKKIGGGTARARDLNTVDLQVPANYQGNTAQLIASIEPLTVETDQAARIVIDEATGTIVMGDKVRIDTVAIAQGNLVVSVSEEPQVAMPGAFAPEGTPAWDPLESTCRHASLSIL